MFFDGTPLLVPEAFNTDPEPNGDILIYPEGDRNAQPSGRMPKDGFYFDTIIRQQPIDEATLSVEDNLQEFTLLNEDDLNWYRSEAKRLAGTDKAALASFGGTAFGDIALAPGQWLKQPRGIRDITEWYTSALTRRDFVYELFSRQCDIGLANLERLRATFGDLVTAVFVTGTDFGAQHGPFIAPDVYRDLYMPFHKRVNEWMHKNTTWKSFIHSCGSVRVFMDDFIEAGFDILNPVQCSACDMDAQELKDNYGDRLTFWGGVIRNSGDTILNQSFLGTLGPGFCGRKMRPVCASTAVMNEAAPNGRPVRSCMRMRSITSSSTSNARKADQSSISACKGDAFISTSSTPARWARALLQG